MRDPDIHCAAARRVTHGDFERNSLAKRVASESSDSVPERGGGVLDPLEHRHGQSASRGVASSLAGVPEVEGDRHGRPALHLIRIRHRRGDPSVVLARQVTEAINACEIACGVPSVREVQCWK
jgi:hypothetical protein